MTIGAIVQARMGSSRLPGKVMMPAAGKPLLQHLMERLARSNRLDTVIVATTTEPQDEPIVALCSEQHYPFFRGSERDVLDRYYQTALRFGVDPVVRITSDCPLIDPAIVDQMLDVFLADPRRYDLITNRHPLTFPDGMDVDIMPLSSLKEAWTRASTPEQREHTIPYFWQAGLRVFNYESPDNLFVRYRWTLDYPEDYALIRGVFEALYAGNPAFGMNDIQQFIDKHPELSALNAKYLPAPVAQH